MNAIVGSRCGTFADHRRSPRHSVVTVASNVGYTCLIQYDVRLVETT